MATKLIVPDVSEHQGVIDWEKAKGSIDAAIIRCGYGDNVTSQDDEQWARNVSECERLGIPYGVYLYSYATSAAQIQSEIDHALRLLKGHKPTYPVYFDTEQAGTGAVARSYAKKFCDAMKAAGYKTGVYTYEYWYNDYMSGFNAYPLWIAKYSTYAPSIGGVDYEAWQYTDVGYIPGIAGGVDISYFYVDYGKSATSSTASKATTKATTPTVRVSTDKAGKTWLAANKGGTRGKAIRWLALKITGKYRVYTKDNGWLPWVNAYNIKNLTSGCAGDGSPILAVEIQNSAYKFRVRRLNSTWFAYMIGEKDTSGSADKYAGDKKTQLDGIQIALA